jgi:hypothetical protein
MTTYVYVKREGDNSNGWISLGGVAPPREPASYS